VFSSRQKQKNDRKFNFLFLNFICAAVASILLNQL
jgi:hypothetical protein